MTISVDDWEADVSGRYIDYDGYPSGNPYQCHDLWLDYLIRVGGGVQSMGYAPTDYTDSVFTWFPVNGVDSVMTRHIGLEGLRRGDVVFWQFGSSNHPWSHVAIALAEPSGSTVLCMSQNPGFSQPLNLSLANALGYLRPNNLITEPEPEQRKVKNMIGIKIGDGEGRYGAIDESYFATYDGYAFVTLSVADANVISTHLGAPFADLTYAAWEAYRTAAREIV